MGTSEQYGDAPDVLPSSQSLIEVLPRFDGRGTSALKKQNGVKGMAALDEYESINDQNARRAGVLATNMDGTTSVRVDNRSIHTTDADLLLIPSSGLHDRR
jgi:hypothetical protein